jgi:aarF domain-containing kinase
MLLPRAVWRAQPAAHPLRVRSKLLCTTAAFPAQLKAATRLTAGGGVLLVKPIPKVIVAVAAGGFSLALLVARDTAPAECASKAPSVVVEPPPAEEFEKIVPPPAGGVRLLRKLLWRCAELIFFLGPAVSWYILMRIPLFGRCFSRHRLLSLLIGSLARCGPVGIKWGQWASTRYDLFADDFCEALGTLTNRAPAHSFACTREAVEASFGKPMDAIFLSFEEKPLASGSIGQVRTIRSGLGLVCPL